MKKRAVIFAYIEADIRSSTTVTRVKGFSRKSFEISPTTLKE
jgi:hypothetical protein